MSRVFPLTVSVSSFLLGVGGVGLALPLVESYALGLVAALGLSLAALVALVVAVVDAVVVAAVAVAVLVWVATVSHLHQPDLDPFPMASVLPQVSRVVYRL